MILENWSTSAPSGLSKKRCFLSSAASILSSAPNYLPKKRPNPAATTSEFAASCSNISPHSKDPRKLNCIPTTTDMRIDDPRGKSQLKIICCSLRLRFKNM
ncbi:hypothetical protein TNCV_36891 [Trichonephila clavipes]|nr:hypothetical protein TNCV_36891 [Trichonephila clavipes]